MNVNRRSAVLVVPIALRRAGFPLLATGLTLIAIGQWLLIALPPLSLAPGLFETIHPVWPDAGPALGAVILFAIALPCTGLGLRVLLKPTIEQASAWPPPPWTGWRRLPAGLALIGAGLVATVSALLATTSYATLYAACFALGVVSLVAGLASRERVWPRLLSGIRQTSRAQCLEWLCVALAVAAFAWLATFDLGSWYYSSIGDEQAFYGLARDFAVGDRSATNLFSQAGVYQYHPYLTSFLDGTLMRLIGTGGVAWKITTIVPVIATLPLVYGLGRVLYGWRVAVLSVGLLATAHYLLAFAHTGYNSLEPLFYSVAAILSFVVGLRRGSLLYLVLAGMFAGLGWYTFYTSRTVIVILGLAVLLIVPRARWLSTGLPLITGFLVFFLPFLAANGTDLITQMVRQSTLASGEVVANRTLLPYWNTGRSLLAFNYNTYNSLYTSGSLVEPITAALLVVGLAFWLACLGDARSRLMLAWYAIGLLVTGVVSQYDHVTISRLHFLLPLVVVAAAVGVDGVLRVVVQQTGPRTGPALIGVSMTLIVGLVGASNLYRWFVETPRHTPSSPTALTMRVLEQPMCQLAAGRPLVVDREVGGALNGALEAGPPLNRPEVVLYGEADRLMNSTDIVERCVIFRSPTDDAARPKIDRLQQTAGDGALVRDGTGTVSILAFVPNAPTSAIADPAAAQRRGSAVTVATDGLQDPHGIAADSQGNLYVADTGHSRVVKFDAHGTPLTTWELPAGQDNAFKEPFKVGVDTRDRVYVLDSGAGDIKRFSSAGVYETTLLQSIGMYGPRGLAVDPSGALTIADTGRNRIVEAGPDGSVRRVVDNVGGEPLNQPASVTRGTADDLYIVEPEAHRIRHVADDGTLMGMHALGPSSTRAAPELLLLTSGRLMATDAETGALQVLTADLQLAMPWAVGNLKRPVALTRGRDGALWLVDAAASGPLNLGPSPD